MEAASRTALATAREHLAGRVQGATQKTLLDLSDELFAVARLLDGQPSLRRALADPAAKPEARAGLVGRLLDGKVSATALDVVEAIARQRWSRPMDLVEAMERLGVDAALDAAEARGELETVEDELFRFGRIVDADPQLEGILGDRIAPAAGRASLVERLLTGRASPVAVALLRNVFSGGSVGNPQATIERLSEAASRRRGRSVAHVTTAVALTEAQERRLTDVLSRVYGRPIGLQVSVDPTVLGGLVVRVGDEVIDGSIADRLEDARRRLVG